MRSFPFRFTTAENVDYTTLILLFVLYNSLPTSSFCPRSPREGSANRFSVDFSIRRLVFSIEVQLSTFTHVPLYVTAVEDKKEMKLSTAIF